MKKSFTLLEMLIAVSLSVFVFLAVFNVLKSLKLTQKTLESKSVSYNDLFVKTIYYDLLNAKSIRIINSQNLNFCRVYIQTSNSLYGIAEPYVLWFVNRDSLERIESPVSIKLPGSYKYIDKFAKNVKIFKIYKQKGKYFVFLKTGNKNIYFEFYKGR